MKTITLLNGQQVSTSALSPQEKRFYQVSRKKKVKKQKKDMIDQLIAKFY